MKLEEQITVLRELGLPLSSGLGIDDLLASHTREAYEARPFHLILFVYGSEVECEPWGRRFSEHAWNFDSECIEGDGSYVAIVEKLASLAGRTISGASDHVAPQGAWVAYAIDGEERRWPVQLDDDWADLAAVCRVMRDFARDGRTFYGKDNGQAQVLFYLDEATARRLHALGGEELRPMLDTIDEPKGARPKAKRSAAAAVARGHLVVTVPVLLVIGLMGAIGWAIRGEAGCPPGVLVGALLAWPCWSFLVPRWRDWVVDEGLGPDDVEGLAVLTGLLWPRGSFLERTEFPRRNGKRGW